MRWQREEDIVFAVCASENSSAVAPDDVLTRVKWDEMCREEELEAARRGHHTLLADHGHPWIFGFLLQSPEIQVSLPNLNTSVYRVLGYFPSDEHPAYFMVEL